MLRTEILTFIASIAMCLTSEVALAVYIHKQDAESAPKLAMGSFANANARRPTRP
jgi:hypothetical protein